MLRFLIKEISLLSAFVILGGFLLLCVWISNNMQTSILRDFENPQISVLLADGAELMLKDLLDSDGNVIRYDIYSNEENKNRLGQIYPELKNVIAPFEDKFFPVSGVIVVKDSDRFFKDYASKSYIFEKKLMHSPPANLKSFIDVLTLLFSGLWLMTMALVLYFNLERITQKQQSKWSLMKMLGAKPIKLFLPLWYGQAIRMGIASIFAVIIAYLATNYIEGFFAWMWDDLSQYVAIGFFLASIGLTFLISLGMFTFQYRRVKLG